MFPFASQLLVSGSAPAPVSNYWFIDILGTAVPVSLNNQSGTPALAELKFMTSAGAGVNAGSGAVVTPSGSWTNPANIFDGNPATFGNANLAGSHPVRIGFNFDVPQTITHLALTSRNDANFDTQAPTCFDLYYSLDGGVTPIFYKHFAPEQIWGQGETKVLAVADAYPSADLSAKDEVGGFRFYAFKNNGLSFAGNATADIPELLLKKSGQKIEYRAHRQRFSGAMGFNGTCPADGDATGGYFTWPQNAYVILDMGYKRVIDEFGYTARTGAFNTQAPTKIQLYGLAGAMANDNSWTLAEMTLLKDVDDSASSPPTSGADRTFAYP